MRLMLFFVAFLFFGSTACSTKQPMSRISNFTMLSLGDSYTIGESVAENDRWSVQLAGLLLERETAVEKPTIIARTGWTTAELITAIEASGNQKQYDLVSLLIGVNNQYRGQGIEQYRSEFRQLLQTAVRFAHDRADRVVVLSIPDWGASPFAANRDRTVIAAQIDSFNQVARQECEKAGVAYVDITPLTRQASGDATQFADDGLHYSGKQMKKWAEKALPVVEGMLKK
jgi:lysophospholipase L1-like esterase